MKPWVLPQYKRYQPDLSYTVQLCVQNLQVQLSCVFVSRHWIKIALSSVCGRLGLWRRQTFRRPASVFYFILFFFAVKPSECICLGPARDLPYLWDWRNTFVLLLQETCVSVRVCLCFTRRLIFIFLTLYYFFCSLKHVDEFNGWW